MGVFKFDSFKFDSLTFSLIFPTLRPLKHLFDRPFPRNPSRSPEKGTCQYPMAVRYELLYILPATLAENEIGGVETKITNLLIKWGATIELTKRLGKLRLAYLIDKQRYGYYVACMFAAETSSVAKIEEGLRISSDILRHLILRTEKSVEEQKFVLVQFTEVNVEEERGRRRERVAEETESAKEKTEKRESAPSEEKKPEVSAEEVEKKIDEALTVDVKGV